MTADYYAWRHPTIAKTICRAALRPGPVPVDREDLPYKVEIWNETGASVEQIVAVTANASIRYAAYYAATREYPDLHITLRHKNSVVACWSGPQH